MHDKWKEIVDIICNITNGKSQETNPPMKSVIELKGNSNAWSLKGHLKRWPQNLNTCMQSHRRSRDHRNIIEIKINVENSTSSKLAGGLSTAAWYHSHAVFYTNSLLHPHSLLMCIHPAQRTCSIENKLLLLRTTINFPICVGHSCSLNQLISNHAKSSVLN